MTACISPRASLAEMPLETAPATLPVSITPADAPNLASLTAGTQEAWFARLIAEESNRYEEAGRHVLSVRAHYSLRATLFWDADRALEAEELGAKLAGSKTPGRTVARLRKTKQGCAWLIARWSALGLEFERTGEWSEPRRSFVLDLLGIPRDERERPFAEFVPEPAETVRQQSADLSRLIEVALDCLDEDQRLRAESGFPIVIPTPLAQALRQRASCLSTLQWASRQLAALRQTTAQPATSSPIPPSTPQREPRPLPPELQKMADGPDGEYWKARFAHYEATGAQPSTIPTTDAPKGNRRARKEAMRRARHS